MASQASRSTHEKKSIMKLLIALALAAGAAALADTYIGYKSNVWYISDIPCSPTGYITFYIDDSDQDLAAVSGRWNANYHGWSADAGISVACYATLPPTVTPAPTSSPHLRAHPDDGGVICVNDDTSADSDGDTCSDYYDANPGDCGGWDDDYFTASKQCCACGGGSRSGTPAPTATDQPTSEPTAAQ
jgi:hypothetical protein